MRARQYLYEKFILIRAQVDDGDFHGPEGMESYRNHIGTIYNSGELEVIRAPHAPQYIGHRGNHQHHFERADTTASEKAKTYYRANGFTEWMCFSYHPERPRTETITLEYMPVDGSATLPPDTGFVVLTGQVTADNILAGPDNYFRPRDYPVTLTGHARLALMRFEAAG